MIRELLRVGQAPSQPQWRAYLWVSVSALLLSGFPASALPPDGNARIELGPVLGAVTETSAVIWCEVEWIDPVAGMTLRVFGPDGAETQVGQIHRQGALAAGERETLRFEVVALEPGRHYRYELSGDTDEERQAFVSRGGVIATNSSATSPQGNSCTVAFGSCADESEATGKLWQTLAALAPDAVVLLGDTPYIDSVNPARLEQRHREFYLTPHLQELLGSVPLYSVWDDHDFGANDTDGRMSGKEISLATFKRFRPNPSFGEGGSGLYHSFRRGGLEVFILDTRYFAGVPEGADASSSLLGVAQWNWLERGLLASTAPFKVVASSTVFNSSVRPLKPDFWGRYPQDYTRLMRFIVDRKISGVLLVSGDVHNSRVVHHRPDGAGGRDIIELVTSPMHDRVHDSSAWSPSPDVESTWGRPHAMLVLDASNAQSPATLRMRHFDAEGEVFFDRVMQQVESGGSPPSPATAAASPAGRTARDEPAQSTAMLVKALALAWQSRDQTLKAIETTLAWSEAQVADPSSGENTKSISASVLADLLALRNQLAQAADGAEFAAAVMASFQLSAPQGNPGARVHFTAYASPVIVGSESRPSVVSVPLLRRPQSLAPGDIGESRAEIVARDPSPSDVIAWISDPLDAYLAQVNGSVGVRMGDGSLKCLVHDGTNNHEYVSLARELIRAGVLTPPRVDLDAIRAAYRDNREAVLAAMMTNGRYVFFREQSCSEWPTSSLGPQLTPGHTLAADLQVIPAGSPVLVMFPVEGAIRSTICLAIDEGGAIKGATRADIYSGIGAEAMDFAGRVSGDGVMRRFVLPTPSPAE
ncbi:MAG: hypothetical protein EXS00_03100 [Phycisphaerales bacterium]|nr:hypothetical protein [Phycisphaerales bacterium]